MVYAKQQRHEFHGCLWHGCPHCYTSSTFNQIKQATMGTINERHNNRMQFITESMKDYTIVQMWEHDWNYLVKHNDAVKQFVQNNVEYMTEDLQPRDCLYGGRTNALKLYYKCKPNERADYIDVNSLYPKIQKSEKLPIGHPVIIRDNFSLEINKYFGLMKCTMLPPKSLYIPVLPARTNGKLVFGLCNQCAQDLNQTGICNHTDDERKLVGNWVSCEVYKAMEKGYKLLHIQEVWHWEKFDVYDPESKLGGLFTSYMNFAMKLKQHASGYPEDCITEADKADFIKAYKEHEGVDLDPSLIEHNLGRRLISKLIANSLWGYFAMNTNKTQIKLVLDANEWNKMLTNDQYIIHNAEIFEGKRKVLQCYFSIVDDFADNDSKTNVALAAFITALARLKLYSELENLNDRVLYFDTDSIIYVTRPEDTYQPKIGTYLGEWTNEIDSREGNHIVEFVSAGPKNYAYKLDTGVTHCTVKGFTLNYLASLKITFDSIRELVCKNQSDKIAVDQLQFKTSKKDWSIKTNIVQKYYGFVYDKRVMLENFDTNPYGYTL